MTHPCPVTLGHAKTCRRPTPDDAGICLACRADLEQALAEIPHLVEDLAAELARQRGNGIGSGSRAFERPMPYDVRASEAGTSLRTVLVGWARDLCEHHPGMPPPGDTLPDMARWLQARLPLLVAHPAAADICQEVTTAVRSIWRAVDNPPERVVLGSCGHDGCTETLYATAGRRTAVCPACATEHDVADLRAGIRRDCGQWLVTASEAAMLAGYLDLDQDPDRLRKRINQWVARDLLDPVHTRPDGNVSYHLGDILERLGVPLAGHDGDTTCAMAG